MIDPLDELGPAALGTVVEEGRGALPFALVHGEALVACAAWALGEAGVTAVDLGTAWSTVVESDEPYVVHDPLCPMTPAAFIRTCVEHAVAGDVVVAGVHETGGREVVTSPVVLPASVVATLGSLPSTDLATLVAVLRERGRVETLRAPDEGRRVASLDDVRALEADTRPTDRR